jgi:hypothetical protein
MEVGDEPVVHPQPLAVSERVAVRLLYRRAGRGADVREDEPGADVARELAQVRSFQAGSMLWKTPGVSPTPYQPTPKPSPFVVSAPIVEWRLWSMSECAGL